MHPATFSSSSIEKRLKIPITSCPWSHFGWKTPLITMQLFLQYCRAPCKSYSLLQEAPKSEIQNPAIKYICSATSAHEERRPMYGATWDSRPFWMSPIWWLQGRKQDKKPAPSKGTQLSNLCSTSLKLHTDVSVFADHSLPSSSLKLTRFWSGSELLLLLCS